MSTSLVLMQIKYISGSGLWLWATASSYTSWTPGTYFSMYNKTVQAPSMMYQNIFLNKSIIFIHTPMPRQGSNFMDLSKKNLYLIIKQKEVYTYLHNFSVSCFSSSGIRQSHQRDGCQAIGINSSFIEAFWTLPFWYLFYHLIISLSSQYSSSSCHIFSCFCVTNFLHFKVISDKF